MGSGYMRQPLLVGVANICLVFLSILIIVLMVPSFQGMIALRRNATEITHEDYMDAILEVQAKKKTNLNYYA